MTSPIAEPKLEPVTAAPNTTLSVAMTTANNTQAADSFALTTAVPDGRHPLHPASKPGTLRLAIKPWGEVYVDGKKVGVTPPMQKVMVKPGTRKIEVRNAGFMPFSTTVEIKPQSFLSISHQFDSVKTK